MARVLALVALASACDQGRRARETPPPPAPVPIARDAATDAPLIDASTGADARDFSMLTEVPDFGCLAWSPARRVVACVIGTRSVNRTGSDVSLVFASLRDDGDPGVLPLLHDDGARGNDALPAQLARDVRAALDGMTPLDRTPNTLAWQLDDTKLRKGPAAAYVDASLVRDGVGAFAAKYDLSMSRHGESLEERADVYSGITIRVFTLERSTIIEESWSTGDEGEYSTNGNVWVCRKTCVAVTPPAAPPNNEP